MDERNTEALTIEAAERPAQTRSLRFCAPYALPDEALAAELLAQATLAPKAEARIDALATRLIEDVRTKSGRIGALEDFLREYSLSTEEGLALMVLAEALLRIPDTATADKLLEDKLAYARWNHHAAVSDALLVSASAWALGMTARILQKGETENIVATLGRRMGMGALRAAARQAMQLLGSHFVLGRRIEDGLARANGRDGRHARYSFDMLGEGARSMADAEHYFAAYAHAIEAIGAAAGSAALPERHGISVKLSALHPRYEAQSRDRVMRELLPRVTELARRARLHDLNFTVDAEEADRLELSLDLIDALLTDPELAGWAGLGLAVQAYQKRAAAVIDHVIGIACQQQRRVMLRLVKGAYWDTEVKRAQERGLEDYPVFTRKPMTDLNYLFCARKLLAARDCIYPQFATHNALTIATIIAAADGVEGYEFQRLHGMGEGLYKSLHGIYPTAACRIYAPVGGYENLLAYLVRRLLENGANSSFVARLGDPKVKVASLLLRPQSEIGVPERARAERLPLPRDIQQPERRLAAGIEFGERQAIAKLVAEIGLARPRAAAPSADLQDVVSPIAATVIGRVRKRSSADIGAAMRTAKSGFRSWSRLSTQARAAYLDRCAQKLEAEAPRFLALLQIEAGKTLEDAVGEWREAIDFCRYYAALARRQFGAAAALPGPTGEDNRLMCHGRGVFACISPWNFPLSIFLGQVAGALVAGNAVLAKPAEQTPLIAAEAVRCLHESGVPADVLQLLPGDGAVGAALVAEAEIAGVAFTGSTMTALAINRALAAKSGPIVPLIAETGGINTMIVDATALPEQVSDDVVASAFRSAGQRCSALRLLCVQEDVADRMIAMIAGAARELFIGDPRDIGVHVGPVIDAAAQDSLQAHIAAMRRMAVTHYAGHVPESAPTGFYVAPHIFELGKVADLEREVFGPVLHVVRYKEHDLDAVLDAIEAQGFGLTMGVHSRIDATVERIVARRLAGNVYVNRSMIGAVVGTQPFGGFALSGTGPKAGGPQYLSRFCQEQTVTINTAAAGGNASLIASG